MDAYEQRVVHHATGHQESRILLVSSAQLATRLLEHVELAATGHPVFVLPNLLAELPLALEGRPLDVVGLVDWEGWVEDGGHHAEVLLPNAGKLHAIETRVAHDERARLPAEVGLVGGQHVEQQSPLIRGNRLDDESPVPREEEKLPRLGVRRHRPVGDRSVAKRRQDLRRARRGAAIQAREELGAHGVAPDLLHVPRLLLMPGTQAARLSAAPHDLAHVMAIHEAQVEGAPGRGHPGHVAPQRRPRAALGELRLDRLEDRRVADEKRRRLVYALPQQVRQRLLQLAVRALRGLVLHGPCAQVLQEQVAIGLAPAGAHAAA
mmetsp:Transcript_90288/g.292193  ORF Transcript_90288/g.292193 Transcript_90288/m.292193 type:complete len:321 (+) Transcript_90288:876-1838(+)